MPTFDTMMKPTIQALKMLGGSGSTDEIYKKVCELLNLPDEVLSVQHGTTSQSEVEYRLSWSRTYLKRVGMITNSSRGVWAVVFDAIDPSKIDPQDILRQVREADRGKADDQPNEPEAVSIAELVPDLVPPEETEIWHENLHKALLSLSPAAFERLAQRLLRESGFIEVEVTGRSNDGGIDGVGIARVNGFLGFRVLFQCKRYQGSVSPSQIWEFRGAMTGRTDKGLFITTGTFTREAIKEATRDGVPSIDLIDGEHLVGRLKELGLGVNIKMVESVEVDKGWFAKL